MILRKTFEDLQKFFNVQYNWATEVWSEMSRLIESVRNPKNSSSFCTLRFHGQNTFAKKIQKIVIDWIVKLNEFDWIELLSPVLGIHTAKSK